MSLFSWLLFVWHYARDAPTPCTLFIPVSYSRKKLTSPPPLLLLLLPLLSPPPMPPSHSHSHPLAALKSLWHHLTSMSTTTATNTNTDNKPPTPQKPNASPPTPTNASPTPINAQQPPTTKKKPPSEPESTPLQKPKPALHRLQELKSPPPSFLLSSSSSPSPSYYSSPETGGVAFRSRPLFRRTSSRKGGEKDGDTSGFAK